MDFVVFSDDWGAHPSSCQHIFYQVAQHHRVLWVNTVGMRAPRLSLTDLRKAVVKLRGMAGAAAAKSFDWIEKPAGLEVIQPFMLPLPQLRLAERFNRASVIRQVTAAMRRLIMRDAVIVSTVPNVGDVVARLPARAKIYYCVDDFSQWPGLAHDAVRRMEDRLLDNVDVVLAASATLRDRMAGRKSPVHLLPHGVDLEMFHRNATQTPEWLAALRTPRAGFYGLLDERFDQELLERIAATLPDWTFVLAGPQVAPMTRVEKLPNVQLPGRIPYAQLPGFVSGLDALILPYRVDEFTHTLAPLKLNEYLLSGLPVISSAIAGVSREDPLVRIAGPVTDWVAALSSALHEDRQPRQRRAEARLADSSWKARAAALVGHAGES